MSDAARQKCTIYVGGLDQAVIPHTLLEAFIPFGEIVDVSIPKPDQPRAPNGNVNANGKPSAIPTDAHRGFAYVEFELPVDAEEAIDNMNGSELFGKVIKVAAAKPAKVANEGLGSKTAVWEQEGYLAQHAAEEDHEMEVEDESHDVLSNFDVAGPKAE